MNNQTNTQERIIEEVNNGSVRQSVIKLISGLFVLAILIALAVFGIGKLLNNSTVEIDSVTNSIEQSISKINNNDFEEDLKIDYVEEGAMTETGQEVNDNLLEIDTMLVDINNQSDFEDMGTINFSE
jgi:hypothetical protein